MDLFFIRTLLLTWTLLALHDSVHAGSTGGNLFQKYQGVYISGGLVGTTELTKQSLEDCTLRCGMDIDCRSASFNSDSGQCVHSRSALTDSVGGLTVVEDTNWTHVVKTAMADSWVLAFRASERIGESVWSRWEDSNSYNVGDVQVGCQTVYSSLPCDHIYTTKALYDWNNVTQVKIAFYLDGVEVAYASFSASGLVDKNHFLNLSRLLDSSYSDLLSFSGPAYSFFGIHGPSDVLRYFYVVRYHNGCHDDHGWMAVIDEGYTPNACDWDKYSSYPIFIYSEGGTSQRFDKYSSGFADVFVVFLKY